METRTWGGAPGGRGACVENVWVVRRGPEERHGGRDEPTLQVPDAKAGGRGQKTDGESGPMPGSRQNVRKMCKVRQVLGGIRRCSRLFGKRQKGGM